MDHSGKEQHNPPGQARYGDPQAARYYIAGGRQFAVPQRRILSQSTPYNPRPLSVTARAPVYSRSTGQPTTVRTVKILANEDTRPRYTRSQDKSRGLRHFSSRVCEKVKEKVQTNYNEVADELVAEYFESLSYPPQSSEKQTYDSKNIRRRVYDALNVLMAMNIIEKEKKEIRWVGLPTSSVAERKRLEEEKENRKKRIKQKQEQLRDYIVQLVAYKSLVNRNRELERANGRPMEHSILYLPFIIINTEKKTYIDCAISQDKTEYAMTFDRPFEIHDDIEVLKRLGMSFGLDSSAVPPEKLDEVKQCLPPALRVYVDSMMEAKPDLDKLAPAEIQEEDSLEASNSNSLPMNVAESMSASPAPRYTQRPPREPFNVQVPQVTARTPLTANRVIGQPRYIQRTVPSTSQRYIQPSQSASFQANRGRQLYVVQNPQMAQQRYYRQPAQNYYLQPSSQVVQQPQYEEYEYEEEMAEEASYPQ